MAFATQSPSGNYIYYRICSKEGCGITDKDEKISMCARCHVLSFCSEHNNPDSHRCERNREIPTIGEYIDIPKILDQFRKRPRGECVFLQLNEKNQLYMSQWHNRAKTDRKDPRKRLISALIRENCSAENVICMNISTQDPNLSNLDSLIILVKAVKSKALYLNKMSLLGYEGFENAA